MRLNLTDTKNTDYYTKLDIEFLEKIQSGVIKTYKDAMEKMSCNKDEAHLVYCALCSRYLIKENPETNEFYFPDMPEGERVMLEGNSFLPVTVVETSDKVYVSRGEWYVFNKPFDIRLIAWDIVVDQETGCRISDLVQKSAVRDAVKNIKHLEEYDILKNKIIPFSENIGLHVKAVGEEITAVDIMLQHILSQNGDIKVVHNGFTLPSFVPTEELITELRKDVSERNFEENVPLGRMYTLEDLLRPTNNIPVAEPKNGTLEVVRISNPTGNSMEIRFYDFCGGSMGRPVSHESYTNPDQANKRVGELLQYVADFTEDLGFILEV